MKNDKVCINKTLTYLVLLVLVVIGFFKVMDLANKSKNTSETKAAGRLDLDMAGTSTCESTFNLINNFGTPIDLKTFCSPDVFSATYCDITSVRINGRTLYPQGAIYKPISSVRCKVGGVLKGTCCVRNDLLSSLTPTSRPTSRPTSTPMPTSTPRPTSIPLPTPTLTTEEVNQATANEFCLDFARRFAERYNISSPPYVSGVIQDSNGYPADSNRDGKPDVGCYEFAASGRIIERNGMSCMSEECYRCSNRLVTNQEEAESYCNGYGILSSLTPVCPGNSVITAIKQLRADYSNRSILANYYKYGSTYYNPATNSTNTDNNGCYLVNGILKNHFDFSTQTVLNNAPSVGYCANARVNPSYCICANTRSFTPTTACRQVKAWIDSDLYNVL